MAHRVVALDHVQLAMPAGREVEAERFYAGILGLSVLAKPRALAVRGGRWFGNDDVAVHLGVEAGFRPAQKAHPALRVDGLDDLVRELEVHEHAVTWDTDSPGVRRCYVDDPFGNRIELIST